MKLVFIIYILFYSTMSFARYFECDVKSYSFIEGAIESSFLHDTQKLFMFERVGNTSEEIIAGCNYRKSNSKFIQIKALTKSFGIIEITRCETQREEISLNSDKVIFSNYNDHDAPEEEVRLFKKEDNKYYGELESSWDAKENLQLECRIRD